MSSDLAISVRGLGKSYTIKHNKTDHVTLAEVAIDRLKHPMRRADREQFQALRDISFDVEKGEVMGIVGRNGAGKSTLLKVLSRITEPTGGEIHLWGRVGSLLEVGTGFHPELTGRENVYLNGSILGMSRREIASQFDAIVQFAGVEQFLDTPVKRYSSGMYVRLAFAVAAHLETEILLLDEVLAVGDSDFQARCLGKVQELAGSGRTILLVSHNQASVRRFATRAILLEQGNLVMQGSAQEVLDRYASAGKAMAADVSTKRRWRENGTRVRILRVELASSDGVVTADGPLDYTVRLQANESLEDLRIGQVVCSAAGERLASSFGEEVLSVEAGHMYDVHVQVPTHPLAPGLYSLAINVGWGGEFSTLMTLDAVFDTVEFEVLAALDAEGKSATWPIDQWGRVRLPKPVLLDVVDTSAAEATPSHA